jgi:hypothetical protein
MVFFCVDEAVGACAITRDADIPRTLKSVEIAPNATSSEVRFGAAIGG